MGLCLRPTSDSGHPSPSPTPPPTFRGCALDQPKPTPRPLDSCVLGRGRRVLSARGTGQSGSDGSQGAPWGPTDGTPKYCPPPHTQPKRIPCPFSCPCPALPCRWLHRGDPQPVPAQWSTGGTTHSQTNVTRHHNFLKMTVSLGVSDCAKQVAPPRGPSARSSAMVDRRYNAFANQRHTPP